MIYIVRSGLQIKPRGIEKLRQVLKIEDVVGPQILLPGPLPEIICINPPVPGERSLAPD